jgi:hypothetical protein
MENAMADTCDRAVEANADRDQQKLLLTEQALMFKHCADDADEDACPCRTKYDEGLKAWEGTNP